MDNTAALPLNTIGELLTAVPHMLGYYPTDSLVLVSLHDNASGQARLGATMRIGLPTPQEYTDLVTYLLAGPLHTVCPDALALVLLSHDNAPGEELPHHRLVSTLRLALAAAGMPVIQAVWAPEIRHGAEWVSYLDPELRGRLGDPRASLVGAELTARGQIVFDSREQMCALIAPADSGATAARWATQLDGLALEAPDPGDALDQHVQDINEVIDGIAAGQDPDEHTLVRILHWLQTTLIRDAMLPTLLSSDKAHAAEHLWLALVRNAPAPELAEPAALLALSTYLRGEGALARIAVTRAKEANPDHILAGLLERALDHGIPPGDLASLLADTVDTTTQH